MKCCEVYGWKILCKRLLPGIRQAGSEGFLDAHLGFALLRIFFPLGTSGELSGIRQIKIEPDELDIIQITVPGKQWAGLKSWVTSRQRASTLRCTVWGFCFGEVAWVGNPLSLILSRIEKSPSKQLVSWASCCNSIGCFQVFFFPPRAASGLVLFMHPLTHPWPRAL